MLPVEYVRWIDSAGSGRWETVPEVRGMKAKHIQTIGFVIHEDEESMLLALCYDEADDPELNLSSVLGHITIPKVAIKSRTVVTW